MQSYDFSGYLQSILVKKLTKPYQFNIRLHKMSKIARYYPRKRSRCTTLCYRFSETLIMFAAIAMQGNAGKILDNYGKAVFYLRRNFIGASRVRLLATGVVTAGACHADVFCAESVLRVQSK